VDGTEGRERDGVGFEFLWIVTLTSPLYGLGQIGSCCVLNPHQLGMEENQSGRAHEDSGKGGTDSEDGYMLEHDAYIFMNRVSI
jgi:hypothetical protein